MQQQEEHNWVIVSKKPGRGLPYWRPNSAGYTDSVTDAGKYSYEEAARIVQGNHGDDEKYCLDDPALLSLIRNQNMVRGKELALWLEVAQLRTAVPRPEALPPLQDAEVAGRLPDAVTNAIGMLEHLGREGVAEHLATYSRTVLQELRAAEARVPQWVSVSERLPEPGVPVLVCEHRDDCDINLAEYQPDEVDEDDPDKWEYGYGEWSRPSFWMPLPAQPVALQEALCAQLRAEQEGGADEAR